MTDKEWKEMGDRLDEIERSDPMFVEILSNCLEEAIEDILTNKTRPIPQDIKSWLKGLAKGIE